MTCTARALFPGLLVLATALAAPRALSADPGAPTLAEKAASVAPTEPSYPPGDLRRYGAKGNGTADDSAAFERAALQSAQPQGATVRLAAGTYRVARDIRTRSAGRVEIDAGARIAIDAGRTLTIATPLAAGPQQVFSGAGKVTFDAGQPGKNRVLLPEWWGCQPDGATPCAAAVQAALNAAPIGGTVQLQLGTYLIGTGLTIGKSLTLRGANRRSSGFLYDGKGGDVITVGDDVTDVLLTDFSLDQKGTAANGITLRGVHNWVERLFIWPTVRFTGTALRTRPDRGRGSQVLDIGIRDTYVIGARNTAAGVTPVCYEFQWAVNVSFQSSWAENCRTGILAGSATAMVGGLAIVNGYINAFHSAGTDSIGIHIRNAQSFSIGSGTYIEMAADANAADTGHTAIRVDASLSGYIGGGTDLIGNGQGRYAIALTSPDAKGVLIDGIDCLRWVIACIDVRGAEYLKVQKVALSGTAALYPATHHDTIVRGALTPSIDGLVRVETENGGASDELLTIRGGQIGQALTLMAHDGRHVVVVRRGGNIRTNGDFKLDGSDDRLTLMFDGSSWVEVARVDSGAQPGPG